MPRAADAHASADKWGGWILAAHGHGAEWARVFDAGPDDSEQVWQAIAMAVLGAPVSTLRARGPHGVICGVEVAMTINDRTATVTTAWHYADEGVAPRLVTAYPSP